MKNSVGVCNLVQISSPHTAKLFESEEYFNKRTLIQLIHDETTFHFEEDLCGNPGLFGRGETSFY